MPTSTQPQIKEDQPKLNPCLNYAYQIKRGEAKHPYIFCLEDNSFYYYINGSWVSLYIHEFIDQIQNELQPLMFKGMPFKKEVAENFKCVGRFRLDKFNTTNLINLQNGMLEPITAELREHCPTYYSTNQIPYKYNPEEKCDLWIKTLDEIFEGDELKISLLQEFFGYCLTKDVRMNKAMLLLGESNSGKSTILGALMALVGEKSCSAVPLKQLQDPQYTANLINKLLNVDPDVCKNAVDYEAQFKVITRGDPLNVKVLYTNPFHFRPFCKMVMAANIFPKITDHSSAFYNRLILIPCNRIFTTEEQNNRLDDLLIEELPGILNWAITGLNRLYTRGHFEQHHFMQDAVEELENENNPVNLFFDEHVEVKHGEHIEKGDLYEKYKSWSEKTHNYQLSSARFASCVFRHFHKQTPKDLRLPNNGKRIWKNISYIIERPQGELVSWAD